jgi:hypothetical protein
MDTGFRLLNLLLMRKLLPSSMIVNTPQRLTRGVPLGKGTAPPGACMYWAAAHRDGEQLAAYTVEGEDDYLVTALGTIAFGEALVARHAESTPYGVTSVEDLLQLDDVTPRLVELGVRITAR